MKECFGKKAVQTDGFIGYIIRTYYTRLTNVRAKLHVESVG
jgi:hypothetical protein